MNKQNTNTIPETTKEVSEFLALKHRRIFDGFFLQFSLAKIGGEEYTLILQNKYESPEDSLMVNIENANIKTDKTIYILHDKEKVIKFWIYKTSTILHFLNPYLKIAEKGCAVIPHSDLKKGLLLKSMVLFGKDA